MIYKIIIATTAICRPELHTRVFNQLLEILAANNWKVKYEFVINIDNISPPLNNPATLQETKINFENIFNSSPIKYKYEIMLSEQPCFFNAVKRLSEYIKKRIKEIPNLYVLYFEDDWMLRNILPNEINIRNILNKYGSSRSYINISHIRKRKIKYPYKFSPALWGSSLWLTVFYKAIVKRKYPISIDPEYAVKIMSHRLRGGEFKAYNVPHFEDVGRKYNGMINNWANVGEKGLLINYAQEQQIKQSQLNLDSNNNFNGKTGKLKSYRYPIEVDRVLIKYENGKIKEKDVYKQISAIFNNKKDK